jgi:hypothetical protein
MEKTNGEGIGGEMKGIWGEMEAGIGERWRQGLGRDAGTRLAVGIGRGA